jgi:lipopolysaccharide transport system permease protein
MAHLSDFPVTTHTAAVCLRHPRVFFSKLLNDIRNSRALAWEMLKRDLKSQYRTSFSGIFVSVMPALTAAVLAVLFRDAHMINVGKIGMPYPFFVLCGMMLWAAFLESLDAPISAVRAETGLLSKANVPAETVTVARLGQVLFNFSAKALVIVVAAMIYRVPVHWTVIFVPLGVFLVMALGAAIGLILAPLNMLYADVSRLVPVITTFWFFTTPILFVPPIGGWAAFVMNRLNPVTALLTTTRDLAFDEGLRITAAFEVSSAFTLCLLCFGVIFHRIAMPIVIDRENS